jgi:hypothetical protein
VESRGQGEVRTGREAGGIVAARRVSAKALRWGSANE